MASRKEKNKQREAQREQQSSNSGDTSKKDTSSKKEDFIRVPSNNTELVRPGSRVFISDGKSVEIKNVIKQKIPVYHTVELDVLEVQATDGPFKGARMYYPYPSGADVRIEKTQEIVYNQRLTKLKSMFSLDYWFGK